MGSSSPCGKVRILLRSISLSNTWFLLTLLIVSASTSGQSQSLVPLDDSQPSETIGPSAIVRDQPHLFGRYTHIWPLDTLTQVIQYHGDFNLHLGDRRLSSQDAVIWMTKSTKLTNIHYDFEVFLSKHAQVRDSAGTVTSGSVLFVTFSSAAPAVIHNDVHTVESSLDTALYREGAKIRQAFHADDSSAKRLAPLQVFQAPPSETPLRPEARPAVHFSGDALESDIRAGTVTVVGNVYVSQGLTDSAEFLELRTDSAVLFLDQSDRHKTKDDASGFPAEPSPPQLAPSPGDETGASSEELGASLGMGSGAGAQVTGVYLRGNVILSRGEWRVRASELYYDFQNDRALILDVVMPRPPSTPLATPSSAPANSIRRTSTLVPSGSI